MANLINIPNLAPGLLNLWERIKGEPLVNDEGASGVIIHPYGRQPKISYDVLWGYYKSSPEMIALFTAIAEDVISDGWSLEGGRNNKKVAEAFLQMNHAKETFMSVIIDQLVTGDAYIYKKAFTEAEARTVIREAMHKNGLEHKSEDILTREQMKAFDEDIFSPRSFVDVASSTMKANYDKYGNLIDWIQKSAYSTQKVTFTKEEIIHFRLMKLNGEFYGFSPLQSLLRELDTLSYVKDYARYYFEKGGVPNFMFILKNENPKSPTFKVLKKTLQLYSNLTNKYKSLMLCGDVEIKEINKMDKDMEYKELALYLTRLIATVWGVPASRLPVLMTKDSPRGDIGANDGYYRKISHLQDLFEDMINNFLLKDFKVRLKFNRTYLQDEVREVNVEKIKTDVIEQRLRLGLINKEAAWRYLDIPERDRPKEEVEATFVNQFNQAPSGKDLQKNENKLFDDNVKRERALENKQRGDGIAI